MSPTAVARAGAAAGELARPPVARHGELASAYRACLSIARNHYENFTVGSLLLPRALRRHVAALYAFARVADDFADEGDVPREERLARLDAWEWALEEAYRGRPTEPIFLALADTAARFAIPITPFRRLLRAFRSDVDFRPFPTFAALRAYCRDSADPVGHLVLYLFNHRDERRQELSDKICTGLQLANFWQDVKPDLLERDRVYIPQDSLARFEVSEAELRDAVARGGAAALGPAFLERWRALMRFEVERARGFFERGFGLLPLVRRELRIDLELFGRGGVAVLDAVERQGYDVLARRPRLGKGKKAWLVLKAFLKLKLSRTARG